MLFTQHFYHCQEENYKSLSDHSSYVPQIVVRFPEPQLTARCWTVRPELDIETRPVSFSALPCIFKLHLCAGGQVYAQILPPSPKLPGSLSKMISCVSSEWFMISLREPSIHPHLASFCLCQNPHMQWLCVRSSLKLGGTSNICCPDN